MRINRNHPRFASLSIRERLTKAVREGIMVPQGLIAHGRGEAFDYLLGEKTTAAGSKATAAAAAFLLTSDHPVVSVNGNTAALAGKEIVRLASVLNAPIEVNLFHPSTRREQIIAHYLTQLGAREVLGVGKAKVMIRGIASPRRRMDPQGIGKADSVLVPLEDGDRVEALRSEGKKVIAVDLNPLSRTSQAASVSIVDNVVRAIPSMTRTIASMKRMPRNKLVELIGNFDNNENLRNTIQEMIEYLTGWERN